MSSNSDYFLKKALGEDYMESLQKFELWKQGTKTVIDHEEIKTALKIVPRTLMSFLINSLTPMAIGEHQDIALQVANHPDSIGPDMLHIDKHERDVYSGEIVSNNKKIAEFKYRSIPGVGLVIMSAFELYSVDDLEKEHGPEISPDLQDKVQKMIDERIALHDLVGRVVEKKLSERDAVQNLLLKKLTEEWKREKEQIAEVRVIAQHTMKKDDPYHRGIVNGIEVVNSVVNGKDPNFVEPSNRETELQEDKDRLKKENKKLKKQLQLKEFLENRDKKHKPKEEYSQVYMVKSEHASCPDCGKNIFDGNVFSGCVCFGDDMDKKIYIQKSESGVKVRFGKDWDPENIEMLLEVLRRKHV